MCSQAIDQNIFPEVLRSPQYSIARSQRLRAIEHLADLRTKGEILLIYSLATHEITVLLPNNYPVICFIYKTFLPRPVKLRF